MKSRERVLRAIHHQPADRVPIDVGGTRQSGIAASTYHLLKQRLGLGTPTRVYDLYQMLAEIELPVIERFGGDVVGLYRPDVAFGIVNENWRPWTTFDGTQVEVPAGFRPRQEPDGSLVIVQDGQPIARMPRGGFYFDRLEKFPGAAHIAVEGYQPPLLTEQQCAHFRAQSHLLYDNTDFAIVAPLGPPYELFYGLGTGDFENWMMTLACEPDYVHRLYDCLVTAWIENLKRFVDAVEDRVQILQICDDFGTQQSLFLSVDMYRHLVMPHYQRGLEWVHTHTDMKVLLHSDGAIFPLLPSLIETGVDILNPVQTSAVGMDPVQLKQQFGNQLTFWGGSLDCQKTLPYGSVEEVVAEVQRHVEVFAPGGGYVFTSVHNVQANVPPENVIAMYDTALKFRFPTGSPT
ncbi:MAG: uroporphyrinogen decarboxylase family protein [Pirellulaceae bacterium]